MKTLVILFLLSVVFADFGKYSQTVDYSNAYVARCVFAEKHVKQGFYTLANDIGLDLWKFGESLDVMLTPEKANNPMIRHLVKNCDVVIENVQQYLDEHVSISAGQDYFEEYHRYDEIKEWYEEKAREFSDLATFIPSLGQSVQGRDLFGFVVTGTGNQQKTNFYWQCQIHAREWISAPTCQYVLNYLMTNYGSDSRVTNILDSLVFHVVPITNPDGFEYTWTNDRLWRKNRASNQGSSCVGVDLNRNYDDDHWGEGGSSSNPCSDTYMGSSAGSEPETNITSTYFKENGPFVGAVDWHSYSQLILRPYGWTRQDSPDEELLRRIGAEMAEAILNVHGMVYSNIKSIELYATTGTASDFFYSENGNSNNQGYRAAGYTFELRDNGRYGFLLPPDQIIPTGEEMIAAVLSMADNIIASPIEYNP